MNRFWLVVMALALTLTGAACIGGDGGSDGVGRVEPAASR